MHGWARTKLDQADEGMRELREDVGAAKAMGDRYLRPDWLACLHEAIDVARRQSARSFELRASMSLARLWQSQHRRVEARGLLQEVYGWFTEGLDTTDLVEARALLADSN